MMLMPSLTSPARSCVPASTSARANAGPAWPWFSEHGVDPVEGRGVHQPVDVRHVDVGDADRLAARPGAAVGPDLRLQARLARQDGEGFPAARLPRRRCGRHAGFADAGRQRCRPPAPVSFPLRWASSSSAKTVPFAFRARYSRPLTVVFATWNRPGRVLSGTDHTEAARRCAVVFPALVWPRQVDPARVHPAQVHQDPGKPGRQPEDEMGAPRRRHGRRRRGLPPVQRSGARHAASGAPCRPRARRFAPPAGRSPPPPGAT